MPGPLLPRTTAWWNTVTSHPYNWEVPYRREWLAEWNDPGVNRVGAADGSDCVMNQSGCACRTVGRELAARRASTSYNHALNDVINQPFNMRYQIRPPQWNNDYLFYVGVDVPKEASNLAGWLKLWENVGVAHAASCYMMEVHYSAKFNEITNKAAILAAL